MTIPNYPQVAAAVYQVCTTYDQYLPQLSADVARSWAKVFAYYALTAEELIEGVDRLYADQGAGYRPLPADIAKCARALRREHAEREGWAELEARQDANSRKAADEMKGIAAAFVPGKVPPTERLRNAEDALQGCRDKREAQAAIQEFFAAKREAAGKR